MPPSPQAKSTAPSISSGLSLTVGLTTFPNPFQDEPEQGILPSLISKVKQTFTSGPITHARSSQVEGNGGDSIEKRDDAEYDEDFSSVQPQNEETQTEAQAIAEAVKRNRAQMATVAAQAAAFQHARSLKASVLVPIAPLTYNGEGAGNQRPLQALSSSTSPRTAHTMSLKPPLSTVNSIGSSVSQPTRPPSESSQQSPAISKRLPAQGERHWRPYQPEPAEVFMTPITTTVQTANKDRVPSPSKLVPFPTSKPSHRTLLSSSNAIGASLRSVTPIHHHAHVNTLGKGQNKRMRRTSIATLPDSPSSLSISAMLQANAELSQNHSYVPGFPLTQDDTKSVRSAGAIKRLNGVNRIIKRMRGEGLSKQYWMADEHCKECYDCKSIFTAWRRKHHCRICGQIFCSRCASNIIGARRFGQEGCVRVCNLCLKIMEEYKDDDEDDRRSINSISTSAHRYSSFTDRTFLDSTISPDMPYAKSPFAASQLFTSHPNESLTAIDESAVLMHWGPGDEDLDRSYTPNDFGDSQASDGEEGQIWAGRPQVAAPFRRPMEEEQNIQKENEGPDAEGRLITPGLTLDRSMNPILQFPQTYSTSTDGIDGRLPYGEMDPNHPLIGLRTRVSQAGLTALLDSEKTEGLWRARSHSFAKQPEMLSGASLNHFQLMLSQAIARANLPKPEEWHRVLSSLVLKVPLNVQPNVRAGDNMDVRAYVKIKKVPGGRICDSEYVDGIVITKNTAHKAMPRRLVNPKIMVITFPLDYHRVDNQFMSLDPILAQEKDYLRLLTKRIIDARPHIVLAQSPVSRIALDYLLEANVALARSVKPSAIHQVARCTQADIVASMDRLVLEPRMGRCGELTIQSFDHELIPGRRKTLMRFEGASREQGCTIILRGGDLATLRKAKVITDFMSLVAYHLKNEMILYNDEHNILPPELPLSTEYQDLLELLQRDQCLLATKSSSEASSFPSDFASPTVFIDHGVKDPGSEATSSITPKAKKTHSPDHDDDRQNEKREALEITKQVAKSLEPYLRTVLSASAAIKYPLPTILAKMAELDRELAELRQKRDEAEAAQILKEETKMPELPKTDVSIPSGAEADTVSVSGNIPATAELLESVSPEVSSSTAMSTIPSTTLPTINSNKASNRDPYQLLHKTDEVARESSIAQVEHAHQEQLKLWSWYTRRFTEPLRPENYQGIIYLFSLDCEGSEKPCIEPLLQQINFYQPGDRTVGQFLEDLTLTAGERCTVKTCERLLLFHFYLLVHGERRLQIAMDQFPCPSPGHEDQIITWSYCRQCETPSPTTIIREETWRMSWGAYLEHCFFPPQTRAGFACPHDAFREQIRYFAHRNLAIRIHNEEIDLFESVRPSIKLQVKAETKVVLKNREYESTLLKNAAFFDSVVMRLKSTDVEAVQSDKMPLLKIAIENMLARAASDREEMIDLLNRTYKLTPITDVLALNTVLRTLQDKVVQWDMDFSDIEKEFMPTEKDLKTIMNASHFKRLFTANSDHGNERSITGVIEVDEKTKEGIYLGETPIITAYSIPALGTPTTYANPVAEEASVMNPNSDTDSTTTPTPVLKASSVAVAPMLKNDIQGEQPSSSTVHQGGDVNKILGNKQMVETSGVDVDVQQFVSRLPRRVTPAPNIVDLVQRFNDATQDAPESPSIQRPRSRDESRRHSRQHLPEVSDSDHSPKMRPRMRRERTEQPISRYREMSKSGLLSDGDRSYATNASRVPSSYRQKLVVEELGKEYLSVRPGIGLRTTSYTGKPSPKSRRTSPNSRHRQPISASARQTFFSPSEDKPRVTGKGKTPRLLESDRLVPTLNKSGLRGQSNASRVTSIARHFDRLSREAERERQKRISIVRGKRARPVSVTKAKVQVFDNLRDAFRDEFDTDSSEADNEEDDVGSDDSLGSRGRTEAKARRRSSPVKTEQNLAPTATSPGFVSLQPSLKDAQLDITEKAPESTSVLKSSVSGPSTFSDTKSEISFRDRLQIELPSFETSAPLPSHPATPHMSTDNTTADEALGAISASQASDVEFGAANEKSSLLKSLSGLWAFRAVDFTPLDYPLSASEHIFADSRVIIRENEPTSIIAFTLSSKTYRDNSKTWSSNKAGSRQSEIFISEGSIVPDRTSAWDVVSLDEIDNSSRRERGTHLKYDFESGTSTIFCRIFFAEQFAALRKACECENGFIESLARCVQFDASGGKSGSAFLKTKDDRFIAKEITRFEMDALTKFAPAYFEYSHKAFQGQRPTVLAKIYGFFKIGYNNAITGKVMKMNLLIMENLFYERRFAKIYDLKGSTRNRLIQPTGRVNEVLLDENLLEIIYKHPLYLRDQSKRILRTALFNDTLFLSSLNVMDYSLVVGVDLEKHELVIGIVDYIRTFTWDKKLESWVKDLGAGGKGEPTIVTPKQYKIRFRTAMERYYFLAVSDRWSTFQEEVQIEEDTPVVNAIE
ncbi:hypothetical protein L204_100221 [Cryptococcus depauperatus]|nr:1-phosphatidylinositol-3-phosphate 5-kinase [Cryptococcus depauperatus CBS 7855]